MLRFALALASALLVPPSALAQAQWAAVCLPDAPEGACDDGPTSIGTFVRAELTGATRWLRALGFLEPHVVKKDGRYVAFVGASDLRLGNDTVFGFYSKPQAFAGYDGTGELVVDATHNVQVDGEGDATATAAHELFHAVQGSYPFFDRDRSQQGWIVEGTAQAVEAAYLAHEYGVPTFGAGGHAYAYGHRWYDDPLYAPHTPGKDMSQLYATSHFWLALGHELSSPDRVAYLHRVLLNVSGRDGVLGIDLRLQQDHGRGLADLYTDAVARHARDRRHYRQHGRQTPPLVPGQTAKAARQIAPIATHLYRVPVEPHGRGSEIEIRLTGGEGLRLVVGGQRFDSEDANGERNVYHSAAFATDTLEVQVVNVRDEAMQTQATGYTLVATNQKIDTCEADRLMATLNPVWQRQTQRVQEGVAQLLPGLEIPGDAGIFVRSAERYTREAEPPGTAPGRATLRLRGVVNDGGISCVDPVGTNAGLAGEGEALTDAEVEASMMEQIEDIALMDPEEAEAMAERAIAAAMAGMSDQGAAGILEGIEEDAAEKAPMTVVKLFAPSAVGWQLDMVADFASRHGGAGRWAPNAQAVAVLGIEGVRPQDLRADEAYPARLLLAGDDGVPMYHRWDGREEEVADGDGGVDVAFEGTAVEATPVALSGTVTIHRITGGLVWALYELSGTAEVTATTTRFTYDEGRIDGDEIVREETRTGPLSISGGFKAPASVERTRLGRIVQQTARVTGR